MNKKIFALMFCMIFLVGTITALDIDNWASYTDGDMKVNVKNLFGLGVDYGDISLTSHKDIDTPLQVNAGMNEVLRVEGNSKTEFKDFIKGTTFTNLKTNKNTNKIHHWEIAVAWEEVDVSNQKEEVCGEDIYAAINDSSAPNCSMKSVGTHKEKIVSEWRRVFKNEKIDLDVGENFILRLIVKVEAGDHYDVIPTFFGKKINKWAEFTNPVVDATGVALQTGDVHTVPNGMQLVSNGARIFINATKDSGVAASTAYLFTDSAGSPGVQIANATFSGNNAIFDNVDMTDNPTFWILADALGAGYTADFSASTGQFPIAGTGINYTGGWLNGATTRTVVFLEVTTGDPIPPSEIIVTQLLPTNAFVSANNSLDFSCSFNVTGATTEIQNVTLTLFNSSDDVFNTQTQTSISNFTFLIQNFTIEDISDGVSNWNCDANGLFFPTAPTLIDVFEGKNNATVSGVQITQSSAQLGNAGGFFVSSESDFVNIDSIVNPLANLTIGSFSAWVKPIDATPAATEFPVAFGDTSAANFIDMRITTAGTFNSLGNPGWNLETDAAAFSDNTWTHIALVHDGTAPLLYVNGVAVAQTFNAQPDKTAWFAAIPLIDNGRIGQINANNNGGANFFNGSIDEVRIFNSSLSSSQILNLSLNRTITDGLVSYWDFNLGNLTNSSTNRSLTINTVPMINFTDPTPNNFTNQSFNSFQVNVSTNETYFLNITFDLFNGSFDSVQSTTFTDSTRIINFSSLADGTYTYNVTARTTTNQQNTTLTRSIQIDSTTPVVSIIFPRGLIATHILGNNLSLNWSINDSNLQTCFFDYNNLNTTVTCGDNSTNVLIPVSGVQDLIMWANDSFGNLNFDTTSWTYSFLENNATFNASTQETALESFVLNLTTDINILSISSIFDYNGSTSLSASSCIGSECLISNTFDVPLIEPGESELQNFFWNITIFNGTDSIETISTTRQQNLSKIHLEQCDGSFTTKTLNFTAQDEQNLSRINPFQFDGTFDFWVGSGSVFRNNSFEINDTEVDLCLSPNVTMKTAAIINYDESGNTSFYTDRFYYFDEQRINNTLQDISLYLLSATDSTSFILKVQDENLLPVVDALIEIHRFYPGEGIFRIVQIAKTDDNGKSIGFFETETVDYKFIIKKAGITLLETGQQKVIPETSPFTLTFNTGADLGEPWASQDDIPNLNSTLTFDVTSGIVTYTYVDNSSSFSLGRLFVQKISLTNSSAYTTICNENSTLSSATITCSVGTTEGFYIASGFITRGAEALDLQIDFQIESFADDFPLLALFFGFFLIVISAFMFKFNEIAGMWAMTITIFLVNILGLIKFGSVFVSALIGITIILTWVMER